MYVNPDKTTYRGRAALTLRLNEGAAAENSPEPVELEPRVCLFGLLELTGHAGYDNTHASALLLRQKRAQLVVFWVGALGLAGMAVILGRIASAGMAKDNLEKMMGKTKAEIIGPLDRCHPTQVTSAAAHVQSLYGLCLDASIAHGVLSLSSELTPPARNLSQRALHVGDDVLVQHDDDEDAHPRRVLDRQEREDHQDDPHRQQLANASSAALSAARTAAATARAQARFQR